MNDNEMVESLRALVKLAELTDSENEEEVDRCNKALDAFLDELTHEQAMRANFILQMAEILRKGSESLP